MNGLRHILMSTVAAGSLSLAALPAAAGGGNSSACAGLPSHNDLQQALDAAVAVEESGLNLDMWATVVSRDGIVCAVAFSGADRGSQWPGSRVISAQKANTANAFGLDGLALATANLYSAVQPGGSLYGLSDSNPVDTSVAYKGPSANYGTRRDPMVGKKIGGVNTFGGGLGLYDASGIIGAIGASGDTSCADHMIAWRIRNNLGLDHLSGVNGVSTSPAGPDNIIYDITPNPAGGVGNSAGGFGHPQCPNTDTNVDALPQVQ